VFWALTCVRRVQGVELAAWLALRTVLVDGRLVGWGFWSRSGVVANPVCARHARKPLLSRGGVARNRVTNWACTSTTTSANPPILAPHNPAVANSPPANRCSHHVASHWDPWLFCSEHSGVAQYPCSRHDRPGIDAGLVSTQPRARRGQRFKANSAVGALPSSPPNGRFALRQHELHGTWAERSRP
jgi:hypothetical protein